MRTFTDAAMAAIERGDAIVAGATEIVCDPPIRLWSGEGTLPLAGSQYLGIGDRALAQVTGGAIGGASQGVTLSLSGVDPDVIDVLDADEVAGAPVATRRLIFDSSGTILLDEHVFDRGRIDTVSTEETIGGQATIAVNVEGAARGLGRRGGRMRTDADQRLIDGTDGGFSRVSFAGSRTLYWGGQKPATAGAALGGMSSGAYADALQRSSRQV